MGTIGIAVTGGVFFNDLSNPDGSLPLQTREQVLTLVWDIVLLPALQVGERDRA